MGRGGKASPSRPQGAVHTQAALHIAVLLFGVAGLFGKWIAAPPVLIVAGRVGVATLAFAVLLRLRPVRAPRLEPRERWMLAGGGALLAIHWVSFFQSIQVSTVAVGLLSYSTAPVFVALLEPLSFRERFSLRTLVCALVTVAGVALIVPRWAAEAAVAAGVSYGVLSGLSFAVLALLNRGLVRRQPSIRIAYHQDLVALLLLAPLLPLVWRPLTNAEWGLLVALGLICTALAHSLFIYALTEVRARVAAIVSALEPVYGIALAWLLLGEAPSLRTLGGGALILLAVLWSTLRPDPAE